MMRITMAVLLIVLCAAEADARSRRRTTGTVTTGTGTVWAGGPQEVATAKAQQAASLGAKGHLGGGYGGGNAEGVGFSTRSAEDALNHCCFTGQRPLAGSSVVRGADGWYAVKIYF
jgi:hypothetical protein